MIQALIYTVVALALLTIIGNWLCRQIFSLSGLKDATADASEPSHSAGRWIGVLERLILAIGILTQSWEILASVIALKTVARFQKLDKQEFAEYFLIGSLFSVLWTIVVTSAWLAYDHKFGIDLRKQLVITMGIEGVGSDKD